MPLHSTVPTVAHAIRSITRPSHAVTRRPAAAPQLPPQVLQGLLDQDRIVGDPRALQIVSRMAEYIEARVHKLIAAQTLSHHWETLNMEYGGINDVLWQLARRTGSARHRALASLFDKVAVTTCNGVPLDKPCVTPIVTLTIPPTVALTVTLVTSFVSALRQALRAGDAGGEAGCAGGHPREHAVPDRPRRAGGR